MTDKPSASPATSHAQHVGFTRSHVEGLRKVAQENYQAYAEGGSGCSTVTSSELWFLCDKALEAYAASETAQIAAPQAQRAPDTSSEPGVAVSEAKFLRKLRDILAPLTGAMEPYTEEQANGLDAINERLAELTRSVPSARGEYAFALHSDGTATDLNATDAVPKADQFRRELALLLNRYSMENGSNTPDYMLADYLIQALRALDATIKDREGWHGR